MQSRHSRGDGAQQAQVAGQGRVCGKVSKKGRKREMVCVRSCVHQQGLWSAAIIVGAGGRNTEGLCCSYVPQPYTIALSPLCEGDGVCV